MTMTTPDHAITRHEQIYRRLLVAYPKDFRNEYGEDLVQGFRDLMLLAGNVREVWWRTVRDLVSSATKERGQSFYGGRKPTVGKLFTLFAILVAAVIVGPGVFLPVILVFVLVLIGLPVYGLSRFRRAWLIRRTTGAAIAKTLALGLASFAPAAAMLVAFSDDAGYLVFAAVGLTLIAGSSLGIIWVVITLSTAGRELVADRRWVRPALILIPCVAVLGIIIGASYNSYRQSLGPAGDHSVANASSDTRLLWEAANVGNVDEVVRITTETCADPWVKFPIGNGRHNAKGQAEERGNGDISAILGDYMDDWGDRCSNS